MRTTVSPRAPTTGRNAATIDCRAPADWRRHPDGNSIPLGAHGGLVCRQGPVRGNLVGAERVGMVARAGVVLLRLPAERVGVSHCGPRGARTHELGSVCRARRIGWHRHHRCRTDGEAPRQRSKVGGCYDSSGERRRGPGDSQPATCDASTCFHASPGPTGSARERRILTPSKWPRMRDR